MKKNNLILLTLICINFHTCKSMENKKINESSLKYDEQILEKEDFLGKDDLEKPSNKYQALLDNLRNIAKNNDIAFDIAYKDDGQSHILKIYDKSGNVETIDRIQIKNKNYDTKVSFEDAFKIINEKEISLSIEKKFIIEQNLHIKIPLDNIEKNTSAINEILEFFK